MKNWSIKGIWSFVKFKSDDELNLMLFLKFYVQGWNRGYLPVLCSKCLLWLQATAAEFFYIPVVLRSIASGYRVQLPVVLVFFSGWFLFNVSLAKALLCPWHYPIILVGPFRFTLLNRSVWWTKQDRSFSLEFCFTWRPDFCRLPSQLRVLEIIVNLHSISLFLDGFESSSFVLVMTVALGPTFDLIRVG